MAAPATPPAPLRAPPTTLGLGMASASVARRCWLKFENEAALASYTPFVVCLAAGNLEKDVFRQYVAQDVHFLRAYARAYQLAGESADDDGAKAEILALRKAVSEELEMHNSVLEEWDIDPTKEIVPTPATVKYTKFLLAIAGGYVEAVKGVGKIVTPDEKTKLAAYTIGAMTPCMRLYACLGQQLKKNLGNAEGHPYMKWVNTYSSTSFQAAALQIEVLLDKLCLMLTFEEVEVVEKLYHQAIRLEIEFFSAQPVIQRTAFPLTRLHDPADGLVVFSGFDLTCTVIDSCAVLAGIAIQKAQKADDTRYDNSIPQKSSADMTNSWDAISKQYMDEYEQYIEYAQEVEPFNYEALYNSLDEISNFKKRANARVVESGLLKGITLDDIKRASEHMILQDGCADFFQKVIKKKNELNAEIHILSYCWCSDFIKSSFSSVGCLSELIIHSNEFNYENYASTGEFSRKIESPRDKLEAFKNILSNSSSNTKHLSVYIGDTVGDLLCLLSADVGIVIGSSICLKKLGQKFRVAFVPLHSGLICKQRVLSRKRSSVWKAEASGILYTVSTWSEIVAFIFGLRD